MYLTVAETTAIIEMQLPSTDERRTAWEALVPGDQAVCARQASADIDACLWKGRVEDPDGQSAMWPRVWDEAGHSASTTGETPVPPDGVTILPGGEMDLPQALIDDSQTEWSVASIPAGIRVATAIQAAVRAMRALGYDKTRQHLDAAHGGVTAKSGAFGSVSFGARATSCWANLDRDALAAAMEFARASAGLA
ncbi:MAG: hypothetical protein KJZ65_06705 [Phycisphaerales bacterium]|nr:hypothetical protein [Phycisphaerales bacterium]